MAYIDSLFDHYFLEYASYSIKDRAIPHIDDGLKPVQRRILHALREMDDGKYHKVANAVGSTMKYHPHGDASIYGALIVLANKDLFIEKQGNFGNIYTGDVASAARYIECQLSSLAREVLFNSEVTVFEDSYDGRNKEPVVLPAKVPVLLAQGTEGIAVGMTTRILPHNFIELLQAEVAYMKDEPFEILPDFPTGGLVDVSEYNQGNGRVLVRAKFDTSDPKRLVIREIPFSTTTESLIASIEEAARKNKVKIAGISDFTAEKVEIEIKLARGVYTEEVIDSLYAFTDCELSITPSLLVIKDDRPCIMNTSEVLRQNVDRLVDVLRAELKVEEGHVQDRLHAKTLEQIFIENRIYKNIEEMKTQEKVIEAVLQGLVPFQDKIKREVTREDVDTLLKIPIRRISQYDIDRAIKEIREMRVRLKEIRGHLDALVPYAIAFLEGLIEKYRDHFPRRTQIDSIAQVDVREAAQRDLKLRHDTQGGYLGYEVNGAALFEVSQYDRVLIMRKDGSYSVVDAPDKLFVGTGMLYCGFVDKEQIFNVVYKDKKDFTYIKRCIVDKFILNRMYSLVPEGCKLLNLTLDSERKVEVEYKPKPRLRVLHEAFNISDYPVRGLRAGGIRLSAKEMQGCKIT